MKLFLPLLVFIFSGCSTYMVRNMCDQTNWYEYGKKAAQSGRRLSGDALVKKCEDADANVDAVALDHGFKEGMSNYCQPEQVYLSGKRGESFNDDMCGTERALKNRHAAGVRVYCAKSNGFPAGASGKPYGGICPADLEDAFLPEFNRGRKNYIQATIASNESELSHLEVDIGRLEARKFRLNSQITALPSSSTDSRTYAAVSANGVYNSAMAEDPAVQSRRDELQVQMQDIDSDLFHARERQGSLMKSNRDLQVELTSL